MLSVQGANYASECLTQAGQNSPMVAATCGRWGLLIPAARELKKAPSAQLIVRLTTGVSMDGRSTETQRLPMSASVTGPRVYVLVNQRVSL